MFGKQIRRKYKVIIPSEQGDLQQQWNNCIQQLQSIKADRIFKVSVFVDKKDWEFSFNQLSTQLKEYFTGNCPPYTFISQSPGQHKVSLEIGLIENEDAVINYKSFQDTPFTTIEYDGSKELWASGLGLTSRCTDISSSATYAFEKMIGVLNAEGFTMNDVVRQWNYIPNILDFETKEGKEWQHYQLFNEVRRHYYNKYRSVEGYPAATGIGTSTASVSIDICACKSKYKNTIHSINNPEQVNAYQYQQDVLVGELINGTQTKQAPQFERAKLIDSEQGSTLYISGTASIKGQYTIGLNNPEKQTRNTLGLIHNLTLAAKDKNQINRVPSVSFTYARVYIKNHEDFKIIESICKEELPDVPLNFVQADICRDNLLVEIEAEMHIDSEDNFATDKANLKSTCTHC